MLFLWGHAATGSAITPGTKTNEMPSQKPLSATEIINEVFGDKPFANLEASLQTQIRNAIEMGMSSGELRASLASKSETPIQDFSGVNKSGMRGTW